MKIFELAFFILVLICVFLIYFSAPVIAGNQVTVLYATFLLLIASTWLLLYRKDDYEIRLPVEITVLVVSLILFIQATVLTLNAKTSCTVCNPDNTCVYVQPRLPSTRLSYSDIVQLGCSSLVGNSKRRMGQLCRSQFR
jgi:hypothetical protein